MAKEKLIMEEKIDGKNKELFGHRKCRKKIIKMEEKINDFERTLETMKREVKTTFFILLLIYCISVVTVTGFSLVQWKDKITLLQGILCQVFCKEIKYQINSLLALQILLTCHLSILNRQ